MTGALQRPSPVGSVDSAPSRVMRGVGPHPPMTDPEAEFSRELEVFRTEGESAIQFFYAWLAVHAVAGEDQRVYRLLNRAPLFWNTALGALQVGSLIALGRVFDQDPSTHNLDRLLRIAQTNLSIFSKAALAERKRRGSMNADEWLNNYLRGVYVPRVDDFRRLRRYVAETQALRT